MARRTSRRRTSRKLGTGSRFSALVRKLSARGDIADPRALAAAIGRRKYGSRRFQQLAAAGRRRSSLRRNGDIPGFLERRAKARDIVRSSLFRGQAKVLRVSGDTADVKNELGGVHRGVPIDSLWVEPKGTSFGRKLRRNSRPAPKFKVGDMVQGTSGRMKLFGPQRVAAALYDSDAEQWTYYLRETRTTWSERTLRRASLLPNKKLPRKALRERLKWALSDMKSLGREFIPVQSLRQAQRAIVYAELLGDARAQAQASKYANRLDTKIRGAFR